MSGWGALSRAWLVVALAFVLVIVGLGVVLGVAFAGNVPPGGDVAPPAAYQGDGHPGNSHPHIETIPKPVPYVSELGGTSLLKVYARPKDWHMTMTLMKVTTVLVHTRFESEWRPAGETNPGQRATGVWNIRDLPAVGAERLFSKEWICAPGIYALMIVTSGISDTGHYSKEISWWPFDGWKSKNAKDWKFDKAPAFRQAFKVTYRGSTNCEHSRDL